MHGDSSAFTADGAGMASGRIEPSGSVTARDAGTPPRSPEQAQVDSKGIPPAATNMSHQDLKQRIADNLELLQRTVNEARGQKDDLLDEVEQVLLEYQQIAMLNKTVAIETLEEQNNSSGRVAELQYKVKQQRKSLEAIEKDIKNMDSALRLTQNLKHASYMTGARPHENNTSASAPHVIPLWRLYLI